MFLEFFYKLRQNKILVSTGEYLDLLQTLAGYAKRSEPMTIERFYFVSRCTLVKDLRFFDTFDQVFASVFVNQITDDQQFRRFLEDWLTDIGELAKRAGKESPHYSPNQLWQELEKRLSEQTERHDGGSKWIGSQGRSPFGHSGENKAGVRIGGQSRSRLAIDVLERRYREYRDDERLSVRQFQMALRKLRDLRRVGRPDFSIERSVRRTVDNAGLPEAVYVNSRKNRLRLLLLMDVGGSMSPHSALVSRLFSAASKINHFGDFSHYYFHNIVYDFLFEDAYFTRKIGLADFFRKYDSETRLLFVGDACMNPYELFDKRHAFFEYYHQMSQASDELLRKKQETIQTGFQNLVNIKNQYSKIAWLNPDPVSMWQHETVDSISEIIPMFELTLSGLKQAVDRLRGEEKI